VDRPTTDRAGQRDHSIHRRRAGAPGDRLPTRPTGRPQAALRLVGQSRTAARCPACSAAGLQRMSFAMTNGEQAELRRCGACEWRCWFHDGHPVALVDVLTAVSRGGLPHAARRRRAG